MAAVPRGDGSKRWALCVVVRRRGGEQIPASALFVARIVGEEVLEEARCRLACAWRLVWCGVGAGEECTGRHGCCRGRGSE
jgi:hypothetical protein